MLGPRTNPFATNKTLPTDVAAGIRLPLCDRHFLTCRSFPIYGRVASMVLCTAIGSDIRYQSNAIGGDTNDTACGVHPTLRDRKYRADDLTAVDVVFGPSSELVRTSTPRIMPTIKPMAGDELN